MKRHRFAVGIFSGRSPSCSSGSPSAFDAYSGANTISAPERHVVVLRPPEVRVHCRAEQTVTVRPLGKGADWRTGLVFSLQQGLTVGYRGFRACEGRPGGRLRRNGFPGGGLGSVR